MLRTEMGSVATYSTGTSCNASCPTAMKQILLDLIALVNITQDVVDRFFPATSSIAPFVSKMGYHVNIPLNIYVLLVYMDIYPNRKFDPTNAINVLNLKDVYLSMNLPYIDDPFIQNAFASGLIL
jgi:hypothetical protein